MDQVGDDSGFFWKIYLAVALITLLPPAGVVYYFLHKQEKPAPVIQVVNQPATDEQLVEFWFGNADKSALRKRICGK